jgi:hypothetical protein
MFTIDTTSMRTVLKMQQNNDDALPAVLAETATAVKESVTAPAPVEQMHDIDLSQSDTTSK